MSSREPLPESPAPTGDLSGRIRAALDALRDGVILLDRSWRIRYCNAAAAKFCDAGPGTLVGGDFWERLPHLRGTRLERVFREALLSGTRQQFEALCAPEAWLDISAQPDADGLTLHIRDVTTRRAMEESLRLSEERLRYITGAATDAIWDWDLLQQTIWWNEGFRTLFGFETQDVNGAVTTWTHRIHPEDTTRVLAALHRVIDEGGREWHDEYRFRRQDGAYVRVQDRGFVIRDDTGRAVRMVGGMTDVTEQRRIEAQYLRAQRLESIGTLAGGIAHDLNNLLAPVMMGVELLRDNVKDPADVEVLNNIDTSARRSAELLKQVLSFARGVEGERTRVDLREIVREMATLINNTFPKNVVLRLEIAPDAWTVVGDSGQLHQVVLNLCINARDALPEGGSLSLALANEVVADHRAAATPGVAPGRYLTITVADTGVGISADNLERIFEPFFTTKGLGRGTGLGLATVQGIVRSHGGTVSVTSEPRVGSVFKIFLPASAGGEVASAGAPRKTAVLRRGDGECVLVVDDESAVLGAARQTLESFGYRTLAAENGAEAVEVFTRHRHEIALVVTDMMMPVMDGVASIQALRKLDPHLPIIAASGMNAASSVAKANAAGVQFFLAKPYSARTLLSMVHDALRAARDRASGEEKP